jgi:Fe-S-cluster containining protein
MRRTVEKGAFACRRCGACCRIKEGIVRVGEKEIAEISAYLGLSEAAFIETQTDLSPDRRGLVLKSLPQGDCIYLTADNRCSIHDVKPEKCRTFPYDWTNRDSFEICPQLRQMRLS